MEENKNMADKDKDDKGPKKAPKPLYRVQAAKNPGQAKLGSKTFTTEAKVGTLEELGLSYGDVVAAKHGEYDAAGKQVKAPRPDLIIEAVGENGRPIANETGRGTVKLHPAPDTK